MGVFANHDIVLQFLFVSDAKIFPITRPTIALANSLVDPPIYVGSMSDKLDEAIPIKVAADEFQGWYTTLIPTADAQTYHLQYAVEAPDIIQGPHLLWERTTVRHPVWGGSTSVQMRLCLPL